jgi:cyclopropane-fatty-acyl-phospholipid synthase
MADKTDIDYSYSTMDQVWRLSVGEMADFTGAKYDGDFSLSLEEAQRKKHAFIAGNLGSARAAKSSTWAAGGGLFSITCARSRQKASGCAVGRTTRRLPAPGL